MMCVRCLIQPYIYGSFYGPQVHYLIFNLQGFMTLFLLLVNVWRQLNIIEISTFELSL